MKNHKTITSYFFVMLQYLSYQVARDRQHSSQRNGQAAREGPKPPAVRRRHGPECHRRWCGAAHNMARKDILGAWGRGVLWHCAFCGWDNPSSDGRANVCCAAAAPMDAVLRFRGHEPAGHGATQVPGVTANGHTSHGR